MSGTFSFDGWPAGEPLKHGGTHEEEQPPSLLFVSIPDDDTKVPCKCDSDYLAVVELFDDPQIDCLRVLFRRRFCIACCSLQEEVSAAALQSAV